MPSVLLTNVRAIDGESSDSPVLDIVEQSLEMDSHPIYPVDRLYRQYNRNNRHRGIIQGGKRPQPKSLSICHQFLVGLYFDKHFNHRSFIPGSFLSSHPSNILYLRRFDGTAPLAYRKGE